MDPELLALFNRLGSTEEPLTDDELAYLDRSIVELSQGIDPADATFDDIQTLTEARDWAGRVRAEQLARSAQAEERRQQAAALLAEIVPPEDETPADETVDAAAAVEVDGAETPAVEAPAVEAPVETQTVEPIAAAGPPGAAPRELPTISRLAARTPARNKPRPNATATHHVGDRGPAIIASNDLPGLPAGHIAPMEVWWKACMRKVEAITRMDDGHNNGQHIPFGTLRFDYPEERMLDDREDANEEKIQAVTAPGALAASGGICGPVGVDYGLSTLAQADRPVRNALAQFGATRGGLRYIRPHTLAATTTDGPAALWTQANDIALNSPATKPHATYTCQAVQEDYVDAVTSVVQFGNFQARYYPEQVQQYLDTVDAVHARLAEATLLAAITTGSTAVTHAVGKLGATRELLPTIDLASSGYRYRHRMPENAPLHVIVPFWLRNMVRADLARQLPGDSDTGAERLAIADAKFEEFFAVRNINLTYTYDSPTGAVPVQGWGLQGVGQLNPWPDKTVIWMYHEGAWMFLDGGELNLGMVRDSTLNQTNDFQMFSESFEKAIFRGHQSLALTLDIDPSGASAGTSDVTSYYLGGS